MSFIVQVSDGWCDHLNIFGNDYDTKDRTFVRVYVHVDDLAIAFISASNRNKLNRFDIFNVGVEKSITALELLNKFKEISGMPIKFRYLAHRDGDLSAYYAVSSKAFKKTDWQPEINIKKIYEDTWR